MQISCAKKKLTYVLLFLSCDAASGDETNLAEVVTDGVAEAVEYVLKKEGKL